MHSNWIFLALRLDLRSLRVHIVEFICLIFTHSCGSITYNEVVLSDRHAGIDLVSDSIVPESVCQSLCIV